MNRFDAGSLDVARVLEGQTVAITRAQEDAGVLAEQLKKYGADMVFIPCIKIVPPPDLHPIQMLWHQGMRNFDRMIVGSVSALEVFKQWPAQPSPVPVTCVGNSTAHKIRRSPELNARFRISEVASVRRAEGIVDVLKQTYGDLNGRRFILPRPPEGRTKALELLRGLGAEAVSMETYRIICTSCVKPKVSWANISAYTFMSGQTLECFLQSMGFMMGRQLLEQSVVAVIGPVAERRAQELGVRVDVVPERASGPDLIKALAEHFKTSKGPLAVSGPS